MKLFVTSSDDGIRRVTSPFLETIVGGEREILLSSLYFLLLLLLLLKLVDVLAVIIVSTFEYLQVSRCEVT